MAVVAILDLHLRDDAVADAEASIGAILKDTRAFDGSLGVEVLEDLTDPAHLTIVERWESIQHDEAYRAWRATPEGESGLSRLLVAPPKLTHYAIRSVL